MSADLRETALLDPAEIAAMARRAQSEDRTIATTATLAIVCEGLARLGALAERPHIAESSYALCGVVIELARLDQDAAIGRLADRERQRRHVAASIAGIAETVLRAGCRA